MTSEILNTLDSLAVATFVDIGRQTDENGDVVRAETYYRRAVKAAETVFGVLHGETGLVLLRLAGFYRRQGRFEDAAAAEERIAEITALYQCDQLS